jgi:probable rRNA maturation factor
MPSDASRRRATGRARVVVTVATPDGGRVPTRGLGKWLGETAPARARGEVTVALVSDGRMRALNRSYRGKDYATDVLSFPATASHEATGYPTYLGDIVIATGVAERQADDAGHSVGTELRILALHGLLHLLGYDHETDDGQMARVERKLWRRAGLAEGLIERRP